MRSTIKRLLGEDDGADIIEYALLSALIGTVGILVWQSIGVGIFNLPTSLSQSVKVHLTEIDGHDEVEIEE